MLYFENDYSEGAHPKILERLLETNLEPLSGYGSDPYCASAKEKIRTACGCPDADVYFLVGGTQTNAVVIGSMLRQYEGVVATETGHVSVHEAGAIEYTGHKVLTIPGRDGKLDADTLEAYLRSFFADANHEHMVFPGMVYISHPTEYGTLYSRAEMTAISQVCHQFGIPLYVDGARLACALASPESDLTFPDLAKLASVFYIGGTKSGALCGEAVVFPEHAPAHFLTMVKQQGALLAKGRLLGVQFDTLFTGGLYEETGKNAVTMAQKLKKALVSKGYRLLLDTPTNQIFVILENEQKKRLEKDVVMSFWEAYDETHTVVRFATSWATKEEDVDALIALL